MFKRLLFRNFRLIYRASRAVRHRFTPAGALLAGTAISAGIFGVNTHQTLAYQIFSLTAAALLISAASSVRFRPGIRLQRALPRYCVAGQPTMYQCILQSTGRRTQGGWVLYDELREEFPRFEEFLSAHDPQDRRRNWFDRHVGYPRLMGLIRRRRGAAIAPVRIEGIGPMERTRVNVQLMPIRRGYLHFSRLRIAKPDALGLFQGLYSERWPDRLLVLPRTYRIPPLNLGRRRIYQRGGVTLASSVGDSQEFMSLREYRPGDPPRSIHWRSFAKTGKPVIKEYHDEYFVRQGIVLDTFLENRTGAIFEEAVSVAASFAVSVRNQDALLDILFVGAETRQFTAGRTLGQMDGMLEVLACVEPCRGRQFKELADFVMGHAPDASAYVCIMLAWDAPRQQLVRNLMALGVPVMVLVMREDVSTPLDAAPLGRHPERLVSVPIHDVQSALVSAFTGRRRGA